MFRKSLHSVFKLQDVLLQDVPKGLCYGGVYGIMVCLIQGCLWYDGVFYSGVFMVWWCVLSRGVYGMMVCLIQGCLWVSYPGVFMV